MNRLKLISRGLVLLMLFNIITIGMGTFPFQIVNAANGTGITGSDFPYTETFDANYGYNGNLGANSKWKKTSGTYAIAVSTACNHTSTGGNGLKLYSNGASDTSNSAVVLPVNASGKENVSVSFYYRFPSAQDTIGPSWVEISYNGGTNWTILKTFLGKNSMEEYKSVEEYSEDWIYASYAIPSANNNANVQLRIRTANPTSAPSVCYFIDDLTVRETIADNQPPEAVTGLKVTSTTKRTATITWNPATDNFGVIEYEVFVNNSVMPIATPTNNIYNITNLEPNTSYNFSVKAVDATGNRSVGAVVTGTTLQTIRQPIINDNFELLFDGEDSPLITRWTVDGSKVTNANVGHPPVGYDFYGNSVKLVDDNTGNVSVSKQFNSIINGVVTLSFKVMPDNVGGVFFSLVSGSSEAVKVYINNDTDKLSCSESGSTNTAITPNALVNDQWYNIIIKADIAAHRATIFFNGTSYGPYNFNVPTVTGIDGVKFYTNGTYSSTTYIDEVKVFDYDVLADIGTPAAPVISCSDIRSGSIKLGWLADFDRYSIAEYKVYKDGVLVPDAVISSNETGYSATIKGLIPAHTYNFTVKSLDLMGNNSVDSNEVSVVTTSEPTAPVLSYSNVTEDSVTLQWSGDVDNIGVTGYKVYKDGEILDGVGYTQSGEVKSTTITGLTGGQTYTFFVKAVDGENQDSDASNSVIIVADGISPTAPILSMNTAEVKDKSVVLNWSGATDNHGIKGYKIYQGGNYIQGVNYSAVGDGYSALVSGLSPETSYSFTVRTVDIGGNESTDSNSIAVTTHSLPYDKDHFDIYLCIGQSNMCGRAPIEAQDRVAVNSAYLLDKNGKWTDAIAPMNRYSTVEPSTKTQGMNPTYTFAKKITESDPSRGVGLVVNAVGGTNIDYWQKGMVDPSTDNNPNKLSYFDEAVRRAKQAQAYGKIKGIIWHQGESNNTDTQYAYKLTTLVNTLRTELGDQTIPFIAGQTFQGPGANNRKIVNDQMLSLVGVLSNYDCITSTGTSVIDITTHFDTYSQRLLGERYADKINKLVYGKQIDEVKPTVPSNLSLKSKTSNSVVIGWSPSWDEGSVLGYEVYQYPENINYPDRPIISTNSTSCTITGLVAGNTYSFKVRAFDVAGNTSDKCVELSVQPGTQQNKSQIAGVVIADNTLKALNVIRTDTMQGSADYIVAQYNKENGCLEAIEVVTNNNGNRDGSIQNITLSGKIKRKQGCIIKVFAWQSGGKLQPIMDKYNIE